MKKTIHSIIAVAAAIGLIGFVSCNDKEEKEQTNNNDSGVKAEYTFLGEISSVSCDRKDFSYHVDGNTLTIEKTNAFCKLLADTPCIWTEISNDTIFVIEEWHNDGSNSSASRDVKLKVSNLPKGKWTVFNAAIFYYFDGNTDCSHVRSIENGEVVFGDSYEGGFGISFPIEVK